METINLEKGQKTDFTKGNQGLNFASVGLGWDIKDGHAVDVDAFAFCLTGGKSDDGGKLMMNGNDPALLYFNRKTLAGLRHTGDNLTGEGDGDDETIHVMFNEIPNQVTSIVFAANIFAGASNFGAVQKCTANVYDYHTQNHGIGEAAPKYSFDISEDFSNYNGVLLCEMYRHNGEWKIQTLGTGVSGKIDQILSRWE